MKLNYQRMSLEQLLKERTRLMEAKMKLMNEQEQRKQQLSKKCIEIELMKSMADRLLEVILLNQKIQTITDFISKKKHLKQDESF